MNKEEIIELAIKAGFPTDYNGKNLLHIKEIKFFAKLIAEKEREECAKVCENEYIDFDWAHVEQHTAEICADAIRARGQE